MDIRAVLGIAIGGAAIGSAALIGASAAYKRSNETADRIGMTIDKIERSGDIDISDAIIQTACNDAADRAVKNAGQQVILDGKVRLRSRIDELVAKETQNASSEIRDKLSEQVGKIDVDELTNDIRKKVAEKMADDLFKRMKDTMYPSTTEKSNASDLFRAISSLDDDFNKKLLLERAIDKMGVE